MNSIYVAAYIAWISYMLHICLVCICTVYIGIFSMSTYTVCKSVYIYIYIYICVYICTCTQICYIKHTNIQEEEACVLHMHMYNI